MTTGQKTEFYAHFLNPAIEAMIGFDPKLDEVLKQKEQAIADAIFMNAYNLADLEAHSLLHFVESFEFFNPAKEFQYKAWKKELVEALLYFSGN